MTRRDVALLAALTAIGAALRAWTIAAWPLWIDEALTWQYAHSSWEYIFAWQDHVDRPPLSFALVTLALLLLGTDAEWALRLPSLLTGTLAIPAAYLLGRASGGRGAGLAVAALVTLDPLLVLQARYARMYSLFLLLAALALAGLAALLRADRPPRLAGWAALGLGLGAAVWTHALGIVLWSAVLMGGAAGILGRWRRGDRDGASRLTMGLALALLVGALCAAPARVRLLRLIQGIPGSREGRGLEFGLDAALFERFGTSGAGGTVLAIALAVAVALGLVVVARRAPAFTVALVTAALASLGAGLAAVSFQGFGAERYLIPFWLVVWTCAAAGLTAPRRGRGRMLALGTLGGLLLLLGARTVALDRPLHHGAGTIAKTIAATDPAPVRYLPTFLVDLGAAYELTSAEPGTRASRTWVLIGYRDSLDPEARAVLAEVARGYGARWSPAEVDRRLRADQAVAVGFGRNSVRLLSP